MRNKTLIYGLGQTGQSVLRYLQTKKDTIIAFDTRQDQERFQLVKQYPSVEFLFGGFNPALLSGVSQIVISPGLDPRTPVIETAKQQGIPIFGDVEMFLRENINPVIAVTGSNGKTTVVSMIEHVLKTCGERVSLCGNVGTPVLDRVNQKPGTVMVLELSSFQLETVHTLCKHIACITNISPDHLDRYADFDDYAYTKKRIFTGAQLCVFNADDPRAWPEPSAEQLACSIRSDGKNTGIGIQTQGNNQWVCYQGQARIPLSQLGGLKAHQLSNALMVLGICAQFDCDWNKMANALCTFKALPHRLEPITTQKGVQWFNDSKATNVGATLAAIKGCATTLQNKLICILGGDAKCQEFSELTSPLLQYARHVILIGQDADQIARYVPETISRSRARDLEEVIDIADRYAKAGDMVLFSPACSSLDQFENYQIRGEQFKSLVKKKLGIQDESSSKQS